MLIILQLYEQSISWALKRLAHRPHSSCEGAWKTAGHEPTLSKTWCAIYHSCLARMWKHTVEKSHTNATRQKQKQRQISQVSLLAGSCVGAHVKAWSIARWYLWYMYWWWWWSFEFVKKKSLNICFVFFNICKLHVLRLKTGLNSPTFKVRNKFCPNLLTYLISLTPTH